VVNWFPIGPVPSGTGIPEENLWICGTGFMNQMLFMLLSQSHLSTE